MEEKKHVQAGTDSLLRKMARFLGRHKKKVYAATACSVVAYTGYKLYTSTVYSSDFVDSLVNKQEVSQAIIFGLTIAFQK